MALEACRSVPLYVFILQVYVTFVPGPQLRSIQHGHSRGLIDFSLLNVSILLCQTNGIFIKVNEINAISFHKREFTLVDLKIIALRSAFNFF